MVRHNHPELARLSNKVPTLSLKEAHQVLPLLSVASLRRMIQRGELDYIRVGSGQGRLYIPLTEIVRLQQIMVDRRSLSARSSTA